MQSCEYDSRLTVHELCVQDVTCCLKEISQEEQQIPCRKEKLPSAIIDRDRVDTHCRSHL